MKPVAYILPLFALVHSSLANTEKVIFSAPPRDTLSELFDIKEEAFAILTPGRPVLRTSLPVAFPTSDRPGGLDSWYRIEGLEEDKRYEIRVCWAATQPTTFSIEVFASGTGPGTILLVQSATDFFTTNATLMHHPPAVDVDIILDPYLANIFPQSLVSTAAYIIILAVLAFFISGSLWRVISQRTPSAAKRHLD